MASSKKKVDISKLGFESSIKQIGSLVDILENNETSLEESLIAFEKGVELTRSAQKALVNAEQKVQSLLEESGEPVKLDFTEEDNSQ